MKILVLGKGVSNDGVQLLLKQKQIEFDYLNIEEVEKMDYDLVVKAPGIPYTENLIEQFLELHIKVITDIELAMMLCPKYYICVTGSNGKTTTVTLISQILSTTYSVVTCGNIGYSVCKALTEHEQEQIFVVELSSFQLENATIDPNISVILNAKPCHLDHHSNYQEYLKSKSNITINQSQQHIVVYPYHDNVVKKMIRNSCAKKIAFSAHSYLAQCYVDKGFIYYMGKKILKLSDELKQKDYLLADIMASISVCMQVRKMSPRKIRRGIQEFKGVPFRLERLNSFIYNDAKSTNPYSTIAAISCFSKVSLICGGYDRKENLNCLNDYLPRIKKVYAYGDTKAKVYNYMVDHHVECVCFSSVDEAFEQSLKEHQDEIILFSPMFASFDGFKNYIERGRYFEQLYLKKFLKKI